MHTRDPPVSDALAGEYDDRLDLNGTCNGNGSINSLLHKKKFGISYEISKHSVNYSESINDALNVVVSSHSKPNTFGNRRWLEKASKRLFYAFAMQ